MSSGSVGLKEVSSIGEGWLGAVEHLSACKGRQSFNLMYTMTRPAVVTVYDKSLLSAVDAFAASHELHSTTTVANTIFPLDSYLRFGGAKLYEEYSASIYPRVKTAWGNYFDRLIRRRDAKGKVLVDDDGAPLNPLASLVRKLQRRVKSKRGPKGHYELSLDDEAFELTTYLPEKDRNFPRGGPCLSHISLKLDDANALRMTAFYRSHFYVERALGNLLGLARLQAFVARESGTKIGPLTCIAASAVLESSASTAKAADVADLLKRVGVK